MCAQEYREGADTCVIHYLYMALVGSVLSACGAVIGTVNAGQYYPAGGASQDCILSGTTYDFHSFDFNGQVHTASTWCSLLRH